MANRDIIDIWKTSLDKLLRYYDEHRGRWISIYLKLFLFFICVNLICFWLAMFTAYPYLCRGVPGWHTFKTSWPVGILGALFDSLSFFITVWIVRRALSAKRTWTYVAHLSLDIVVAVLATFWVLFVFTFSSWLIGLVDDQAHTFTNRADKYQNLFTEAMVQPGDNWRNIYFGILMGMSACLPTVTHVGMFLYATIRSAGGPRTESAA